MTNAQTLAIKWNEIKLYCKIIIGNIPDSVINDKPGSPVDTIAGDEDLLLAAIAAKTDYTDERALEEYVWFMNPWRIPTTVSW